MSSVYGIQNALVGIIAGIVYPTGTANPGIAGVDTYIYAGWPQPQRLESDINAGKCHISVYPLATEKKLTEPLGRPWQLMAKGVSGIGYSVSGQQITFSGTVTTPTNINIYSDSVSHVYPVQASDTLTTIATALSALISGSSSSGPVLTMPATALFSVRIGAADTVGRLLRRQEKDFQITVWTATPALRETVATAVDAALSALTGLALSDGSPTVLKHKRSTPNDSTQSYLVYRHDMIFSVDYCLMQVAEATQVVAPAMNITETTSDSTNSFQE